MQLEYEFDLPVSYGQIKASLPASVEIETEGYKWWVAASYVCGDDADKYGLAEAVEAHCNEVLGQEIDAFVAEALVEQADYENMVREDRMARAYDMRRAL